MEHGTDTDNINAPLSDLFAALTSFNAATDGPFLGLFLQRLVASNTGGIDAAAMGTFLSSGPENQSVSFPLTGDDVFPKPLAIAAAPEFGTLDSRVPQVPNPCRALLASHWYHLVVPSAQQVNIQLDITGIAGSSDNLNLYLCTNNNVHNPFASSTNINDTDESINVNLQPGTYVVRIEAVCGGAGNRASYSLTVN